MSSLIAFFFFFQAEDGIRDSSVTGVQTCALPIFLEPGGGALSEAQVGGAGEVADVARHRERSEERRVGKECRSRWWPDHKKKKNSWFGLTLPLLNAADRFRLIMLLKRLF